MKFPADNHLSDSPHEGENVPKRESRSARWWTFPLLLGLAMLVALLVRQAGQHSSSTRPAASAAPTPWAPAPQPQGKTVGLTIDFGNGARRHFDALPWREGMTVSDVMSAAAEFKPSVRFQQRGDGPRAMLTSLEGVVNQGADGRNWLYQVDGVLGQVSFAVQRVQPGQRVLWTFGWGE